LKYNFIIFDAITQHHTMFNKLGKNTSCCLVNAGMFKAIVKVILHGFGYRENTILPEIVFNFNQLQIQKVNKSYLSLH